MQYRYFLPEDGDTVEDAREVYRERYAWDGKQYNWIKDTKFSDHEDAVESAAQLHYERSAPDWHEGEQVIAIADELGAVEVFDVLLEYSPTFSASKRREVAGEAQTGPEATPAAQEVAEQA